jgi:FG-GAP-like repeat
MTANDAAAVASLPANDPIGGSHAYWVATAEAKALGLLSGASLDGYVGFSSVANIFDYNRSDGITAGQYDFYAVVAHEISEVMGRQLLTGAHFPNSGSPNAYEILDLFHYSAAGVRDLVGTTPGYFSINGGTTNLDNFNTNSSGDFGDWAASAGNDAFLAFSNSGVVNAITESDLTALDILGFDRVGSSSSPSPSSSSPIVDVTGAVGDFNHDGYSDILWRNDGGATAIWEMSGPSVTVGINTSQQVGNDWHVAGIGDFDHDGNSDILWRGDGGTTAIWEMNGPNVTVGINTSRQVGTDWHIAGIGDFDGDGKSDILWRGDGGATAIWEMNGPNVTVGINTSWQVGNDWHIAGIGDFDGDGKSDILWRGDGGATAIWEMNGPNVTVGINTSRQVGNDWHIAGIGDFNHDGRSDILWRGDSGATAIWEMDGPNVTVGINTSRQVGNDWHIV